MPGTRGAVRAIGWTEDGHWTGVVAPLQLGSRTELSLPKEIVLTPLSPEQGASGVSLTPTFSWTAVPGAVAYEVEIHSMDAKWLVPSAVTSIQVPSWRLPGTRVGLERGESHWWSVTAILEPGSAPDDRLAPGPEQVRPSRWVEHARGYGFQSNFTAAP